MTTKKQTEANRKNALKSTGPKTEQGKANSSRNALIHGFYSRDAVINAPKYKEDPDEYRQLVTSLMKELKAKGAFQQNLVLKIANCLWRYRRIIRFETARINRDLEWAFRSLNTPICYNHGDEQFIQTDEARRLANAVHTHALPKEPTARLLLFYEMRLDRHLSRAYRLLRHLQLFDKTDSLQDHSPEPQNRGNEPDSAQPSDLLSLARTL